MESFFGRYKNPLVLMAVLFVQVILLATQVKRPSDPKIPHSPGTRLIRVWAVTAFAPVERAFVGTGHFFRDSWRNYVNLRGVRKQNEELKAEINRMRMEQVRLKDDAEQARRLQALLDFREKFISQTLAAQVIGTSGSEQSRVIYIDKGTHDGIKPDMAVITPDGVVGKVKDVFPLSAQVLMISDRDSGAGVILEKSRLQGVLKGTNLGEMQVEGVMADEKVEVGEGVIASGGDRIYPKGLPVGVITSVAPDKESGAFLTIKVRPAADLNRLEEVLVVTKMAEQPSTTAENEGRVRAADILAQRLPTVPKVDQPAVKQDSTSPDGPAPPQPKKKAAQTNSTPGTAPAPDKVKPAGGNDGAAITTKEPGSTSSNGPASPPKKKAPPANSTPGTASAPEKVKAAGGNDGAAITNEPKKEKVNPKPAAAGTPENPPR